MIYDPVKNELFTASKGRGAFLNDRRIRVSKCTRMQEALVGTRTTLVPAILSCHVCRLPSKTIQMKPRPSVCTRHSSLSTRRAVAMTET